MDSNQSNSMRSCPDQIADLLAHMDMVLPTLKYPDGIRVRLAIATFQVAMEHLHAISQLFRLDMHTSAFVLIRPLFEATIKGTWIHLCATDKQIDNYSKGVELPSLKELLDNLEKSKLPKDVYENLLNLKEIGYKLFSSYTHAGYYQICQWAKEGKTPTYPDDEIQDATDSVKILGLIAGLECARMSGNQKVIAELSAYVPQ